MASPTEISPRSGDKDVRCAVLPDLTEGLVCSITESQSGTGFDVGVPHLLPGGMCWQQLEVSALVARYFAGSNFAFCSE